MKGTSCHIAYPERGRNPIHAALPALVALLAIEWDRGDAHFPPTTLQLSNVHAGTGAGNVIPGDAVIDFNFRFSTESTPQALRERGHALLDRNGLKFELAWTRGGEP